MKLIHKIDELVNDGTIQLMIENGLIRKNILEWRKLYHAYISELNTNGSIMQSMENISFNYNVSIELIQKIRKKFD